MSQTIMKRAEKGQCSCNTKQTMIFGRYIWGNDAYIFVLEILETRNWDFNWPLNNNSWTAKTNKFKRLSIQANYWTRTRAIIREWHQKWQSKTLRLGYLNEFWEHMNKLFHSIA